MNTLRQIGALLLVSFVAAFACVATAGCPSTPATPPAIDADCDAAIPVEARKCPPCTCVDDAGAVTDTATMACENLRKLGCWEGLQAGCASRVRAVVASDLIRAPDGHVWDGTCAASAKSIPAAEACGAIRCVAPK